MGYTMCSRHNRKCCWRCDGCPKCDGIVLLRGCYCVECTAKFKAEGAVWIPDYKNYVTAEDYARMRTEPQLDPNRFQKANYAAGLGVSPDDLRGCTDCNLYNLVTEMTARPDGRVICKSCQTAIEKAAVDKAQVNLFVQQAELF